MIVIFLTARQCLQAIRQSEGLTEQLPLHLQSQGINSSMSVSVMTVMSVKTVTVTFHNHHGHDYDLLWEAQKLVWAGKSWRLNVILRSQHHLYSWSSELTANICGTQRITELKSALTVFPQSNRIQPISPESFDDEGGFRGDPHPRAEAKTRSKHQEAPIFWAPDDDDYFNIFF